MEAFDVLLENKQYVYLFNEWNDLVFVIVTNYYQYIYLVLISRSHFAQAILITIF